MAATDFEYPYEASDEASESELLERSLSVWRGWRVENEPDFAPIPLDLHTASSIGQYDTVRNIIIRGEEDLNRKNLGGWSPLMYAAYIGHDNVANLLLDAGVNVNDKNNKGQTPLMLAASCGNESIGYFLLQAGADLEARDKKGWTALFHATYSGHQNMVKFLLDNQANSEAAEPVRELTPFMEAAASGHEIIVQCFLQHGVNINAKALSGDTARSLALINGFTKIVSLIDNHSIMPPQRPDHAYEKDLSSSDESFQNPFRNPRSTRSKSKGLSIKEGPEAFDMLLKMKKPQSNKMCVHKANRYKKLQAAASANQFSSSLDSSGGRESMNEGDDEDSAFTKTGALTIKSSSSSSGGLIAALGLSREGSVENSLNEPALDQRSVCSDPGMAVNSDPWGTSDVKGSKVKEAWDKADAAIRDSQQRSPKEAMVTPPPQVSAGQVTVGRPAHTYALLRGAEQQLQQQQLQAEEATRRRVAEAFNLPASDMGLPASSPHRADSRSGGSDSGVGGSPLQAPPLPASPASALVYGGAREKAGRIRDSPVGATRSRNREPQSKPQQVQDLPSLLAELGLSKYWPIFEEQEVNLQVFLSLTENDLKEVGIKLFGPRRKMTNAIARWHSQAKVASPGVEQVYADRLEAEMQELAIKLHQILEGYDELVKQWGQMF